MIKHITLVFAALLFSGCAKDIATVEKVSTIQVQVPAPCPQVEEIDRLIAALPVALRELSLPPSGVERVSQATAQLGRYEAEGGWRDQVVSALTRCRKQ